MRTRLLARALLHDRGHSSQPVHTLDGLEAQPQAEQQLEDSSSGWDTSQFAGYLGLGFGITAGLIALGALLFCCFRWRTTRARRRAEAAAEQARAQSRRAVDDVQAMIAEKRKARVPPKPVLVVHPGGGAVVAFKIKTEMYSAPSAPEDQIKANMSGGADEDGGKEDELAPAGPEGTRGADPEEGAGPQNRGSAEDQPES